MDSRFQRLWYVLRPFLGTLVLGVAGIGLVVAWALRYMPFPPEIQGREVGKEPIVVQRVVPDTSSVDTLTRQLEAAQHEKEKLAVMVNEARERAGKAEAEIEGRDPRRVSARAAFDEQYSEAKVRPVYELVRNPSSTTGHFDEVILTVRECRKDYLVTSVYEGFFGVVVEPSHAGFRLDKVTISVQDRNMQHVGKPETYKVLWLISRVVAGIDYERRDATGHWDFQPLIDGLETGKITIDGHDHRIDKHLRSIKEFQDKKNRYEAEYAKHTQRTADAIEDENAAPGIE